MENLLNSLKANKKVLLIKLPSYLYDTLKSCPNTSSSIQISQNSSQIRLSFPTQLDERNSEIVYKGKIEEADDDLYVFSADGHNRLSMKATASHKVNLMPERNAFLEEYNRANREKISNYSTVVAEQDRDPRGKPYVFHLHPDHKAYISSNPTGMIAINRMKKPGEKRVRGDKDKVKAQLFSLFYSQKYWKTKALAVETNQPDAFIEEILPDIAEKVVGGQYKKFWTLRSEYAEEEGTELPSKKQKT